MITVQELSDAANLVTRQYFGATTVDLTDATKLALFLAWANETQRDVLHTSVWKAQLTTSETFTSEPDGSPYILTANNIRHVIAVYDVKNRRQLIPFDDLNFPAATSSPPERSGPARVNFEHTAETSALYPQYYIFESCILASDGTITQGLHLLSDPADTDHSGTIRYFYTKMVDDLTAAASNLTVPDDGRDILLAGMAERICLFRGHRTEAEQWRARYESMKKGF